MQVLPQLAPNAHQALRAVPPAQGIPGDNRALEDRFSSSPELQNPGSPGAPPPELAGALFEGMLKSQAQQLIVSASQGVGDVQGLSDQLMKDYQRAREMGLTLSSGTEELIQRALQLAQGQGAAGGEAGGSPPVEAAGPSAIPSGSADPSRSSSGTPTESADPFRSSTGSTGSPSSASGTPTSTSSPTNSTASPEATGQPGAVTENPEAARAEDDLDDVAQGTPSNCGATAVIKQMQYQFPGQAMTFETLPDGSVQATMRDGYTTVLTPEQIEQAATVSDYSGDDPAARDEAVRMNAAASARYAEENDKTYQEGLDAVNGNNWPDEIAPYFGVQANAVDPKTLDENGMAIVANSTHATNVLTTKGDESYQDDHGAVPRDEGGQQRKYDGDIYSNGENTGPAEKAWVLGDVGDTGSTTGKIAKMGRRELVAKGVLDGRRAVERLATTGSASAPGAGISAPTSRNGNATPPLAAPSGNGNASAPPRSTPASNNTRSATSGPRSSTTTTAGSPSAGGPRSSTTTPAGRPGSGGSKRSTTTTSPPSRGKTSAPAPSKPKKT